MKNYIIRILLFASATSFASAASVTFNSVVATHDQGGDYTVGRSIDGSVDGRGWAIYGQTTTSQSANYTAAAPFSGNMLSVFIPQ